MKSLVFVGKSTIRRDPMRALNELRVRFPNVSETGLHEIALETLAKHAPRYRGYVECLFGADILTDDPSTIPAWPYLTTFLRGVVIKRAPSQRKELLAEPAGLSTTYVWSADTAWTQEVNDSDVEVIRRSAARTWFRDADTIGDWRPQRAYDFPVIEREVFLNLDDAKAYEREQQSRVQRWSGR